MPCGNHYHTSQPTLDTQNLNGGNHADDDVSEEQLIMKRPHTADHIATGVSSINFILKGPQKSWAKSRNLLAQ